MPYDMMKDPTYSETIKSDMMELWKDTFHDSTRYIYLVFDTYFNRQNVFVRYAENRLIASMLCIPYEFQILMKGGYKKYLRGVYLCGLATLPEYRRQGIMAELMAEAEEAWTKRGYDLTFLIPADSHLREYYRRKGYVTSSFRENQIFSILPQEAEADNSELYIYTIKDVLNSEEKGHLFIGKLIEWCRDIELKRNHPTMLHSRRDIMTVMAENENSIFLTKDPLNLKNPILTNVVAVAFPELSEDSHEPLRLVGLYVEDEILSRSKHTKFHDICSRCESDHASEGLLKMPKIYQSILKRYNRQRIELCLPYSGEDSDGLYIEPYAMTKPLKNTKHLKAVDNLKFDISLMLD